jgi:NAD(P)-dependent dehydrogenase (short-subunit alcohol dehydrogenase family)
VNTVVLAEASPAADVALTLAYLADDERSGFTTGATIDLASNSASAAAAAPADAQPILVTGAAGGLGRAAAESFLAAGRAVVITDLDTPALWRTAGELQVQALACDVTSASEVATLASHESLRSGISALVVHHGVGGASGLADLDGRIRDRSLRVNGTGVWTVIDGLREPLRSGSAGSVVVLSSQAGLVAEAGNAAYCAAKFAVVGLVRALARRADPKDVRVHGLCPGPIDTPLMREAFAGMAAAAGISAEDYLAQRLAGIPLGRVGTVDQIGAAAMYLTSLRSTGVVLAPTGGAVLT